MEVPVGAKVMDKNGKFLGYVEFIMRDTYSGEMRKFLVRESSDSADLFFKPDDVGEIAGPEVKLKVAVEA